MASDENFDRFTAICLTVGLLLGLVGGLTRNGFLTPLLQRYLGVFGLERRDEAYQDFGTVFVVVVLGLVGAGVMYASAKIERGDTEGTRYAVLIPAGILAFTMVPTGLVAFSYAALGGNSMIPSLGGFIFGILGLVMIIPAVVCWFVMFPLALGLAAGGLFCLPRLLLYYTTRHPLLAAWEKSGGDLKITPADIVSGMGNPASNTTQAVKLMRDLERLERKIAEQHKALAAERERLRSAILGDAERFEAEKRISKLLINVDTLNTEVEAYRKYVQLQGKGR